MRNNQKTKVLYLVGEDSAFCSHRLSLALAATKQGLQVYVATRVKEHAERIKAHGIEVIPLHHFHRSSLNPVKELYTIYELYRVYRKYRPDIVHHVAMKPVVYGSLIAYLCRIPTVINALTGLGYIFTQNSHGTNTLKQGLKQRLLRTGVALVLKQLFKRKNTQIILQNIDDVATLINLKCLRLGQAVLIRGSGVNTQLFYPRRFPASPPIRIACVTRMLWDKGVAELIAAARLLKAQNLPAQFYLYGKPDPANPASIPEKLLKEWHEQGLIVWEGHSEAIHEVYAQCHIAVLPSYREGLPKSLLEAASCGRPIVTTDAPGCREIVQHGENGYLVPIANAAALAEALALLINDEALRARMGLQGRKLVETCFSDTLINAQTLALYPHKKEPKV